MSRYCYLGFSNRPLAFYTIEQYILDQNKRLTRYPSVRVPFPRKVLFQHCTCAYIVRVHCVHCTVYGGVWRRGDNTVHTSIYSYVDCLCLLYFKIKKSWTNLSFKFFFKLNNKNKKIYCRNTLQSHYSLIRKIGQLNNCFVF